MNANHKRIPLKDYLKVCVHNLFFFSRHLLIIYLGVQTILSRCHSYEERDAKMFNTQSQRFGLFL
jgi:hypothetical protein